MKLHFIPKPIYFNETQVGWKLYTKDCCGYLSFYRYLWLQPAYTYYEQHHPVSQTQASS